MRLHPSPAAHSLVPRSGLPWPPNRLWAAPLLLYQYRKDVSPGLGCVLSFVRACSVVPNSATL